MIINIRKDKIDGFEKIVMENEAISLSILPNIGGKMNSFIFKETGREFIWQNPDRPFKKPNYADAFEDYDISGFDECFPSVGECYYPEYPWKGTLVPDHGELWTLPWEYKIKDDVIHLWVYGIRFPYKFEKWICLNHGSGVELKYEVTNLSPYEFKYIWAAHPLFDVKPKMKIFLPADIKVRVDWSKNSRLGPLWTEHPWPNTRDKSGNEISLDTIGSSGAGFADKFYTTKLKEGWCILQDQETKEFVAFSFSPQEIPYVGVWVNQGGWPLTSKPSFNTAVEPCIGYPDRLDIAIQRGKFHCIPPKNIAKWNLKLLVDKGQFKECIKYGNRRG